MKNRERMTGDMTLRNSEGNQDKMQNDNRESDEEEEGNERKIRNSRRRRRIIYAGRREKSREGEWMEEEKRRVWKE
jgi:hypothetical protein